MLTANKSRIRVFIVIAMFLLFFSALQSATACETCDVSCSCTDCSGCPDCGCVECNPAESTEKENSNSISNIFNGSTLSLGDGIHTNFTKISIDKDITIQGNGVNNSIIFIDSNNVAFNVLSGNTLKLYNLTIFTNYIYSDGDIANFNSLVNLFNGSIAGSGTVVFENCKFINNKKTDVVVTVSASPTYNSNRITLTANVNDFNGNNLIGDVAFYINNEFSGRVSIANGVATYSVDLANGNYNVHASYVNDVDTNYGISQNQPSFNVFSLIQPLSVPLPTSGNRYWVDPSSGQDNASRNGLSIATAWRTILYAYNNAQANSSIILQPGIYQSTGNAEINLANKLNMTIIGNDTVNDVIIIPSSPPSTSSSVPTFLNISAGTSSANQRTLNLYNLIIRGGLYNKIYIQANNILNIDSLIFVNSTSGRGIYTESSYVDIIVNNSLFTNLTGSSTGKGIGTPESTVASFGSIRVNNTNFTNIAQASTGGVINHHGPSSSYVSLYNTNIINCTGSSVGAVIRCYGGAGVTLNYTNITDSGCTASSHGGIFCLNGAGSFLVTDNSRFTNVFSGGQGGVTFTHTGPSTIINTIFENCRSSNTGGVIHNAGTNPVTIINSSFIGNNATSGGAINAASSGSIAIFNSTFTNNRATSTTGGAIHAASGTVNITNSSFNNNFATTQGGAINVASGAVNIVGSNFTSNVATTFGGVIGSGGGTVSISTSNFNNNNATQYGGAIGASAGTINANLSNFNGNYVYGSGAYGGALGSPGGTINIYNSAFANNSARNNTAAATAYGGVAGVNGANAVITLVNCTVHDNWAKYGGAFGTGTSGGRINVINNTAIFNNYALEYGGVAGLGSAGTIIIENSRIYNNSAGSFGGAFGVNGAGTINATNSNLTGNDAGTYGGAVGVNGAGTVNLNFVEMIDNMAVNYGGAVALSGTGGTVNVRSSTLRRNHATGSTGYGGAIGLMSGNINVYDSRFENNTAVTYGGAVGVPTGGNFYANNSNFTDNVAGTYGGAIGSAAGVNITYCIFTRNEAGTFGGGVAAMGGSLANSILSCQFEYNYAGNQGYGVYAAGRLTANYNRFFNNTDASGNFNQTIWTNTSQSGNVNIDFNWWGENRHLAVGNLPNNYVVIDFDTVNYGLWNGSAHYVYTILLNDTTNTNFNVSRLPPFMGEARFIVPPYNTSFSAHLNGTVVSIPFVADAYHEGYFRVDNQYISFNVTTNSTPTVSNLTVNLGTTSGKYKDQVTLTATYLDNGGYPVAGLVVDFYVAGVYVGTNTTTANGTVYHSYTVASAGNLNYTVEYNGSNKNYNPINASTILNFLRLDTRIVVNNVVYGNSGAPVILNATIYDEWNDTIGNVTLHFYGMSGGYYTFALTNSNGQAIANYTFPVTGNYTWYAVFDGNGNYTASNSSTSSTGRADISPIVNLTINKNANVTGGVNFGDYVTYTINVTNHGPDAATNVIVLDLLNSSLILQSFTPSSGTYVSSTGLWTIASISVNQTVTLTINVRVNVTGTIPNVATITNVNQPNVGGNTSGVNISSSNAVNLTIVKSSNTSTAGYGDLVTYTINVTNHGPNTATAVSVYDQLDYRLILVNATATIGTYTNNVWSIPSIAAGGSAILTIIVRINGTGNITNLANITNVTEFNLANGTNSSNVNVSVPNTVNLTISKTSNVTGIVGVGDRVTYTINVTNHGPDNATFVNVTDRLSSALLFLNASATIGSYNNNTGVWTVGTLNVGQTATLYINVTIIGTGNIVNVANVTVREVNLGNNSTNDSVTLTVPSTVNFTITKTSNAPATVYFGDLITYTITVRNFGPDNATNVVVTDILDSRLIFVNAVGGNYSMSGNTLFWNISNLNVGSTVTLNITVRINGTGNIVNIANITASQDNIGENGTNSSSNGTNFTVPNTVNLTIVKSTNASANASYLDYVTYTINVTNFGPDTANSVSVYDRLDSRLILLSANATIGTYNPATYIWSIPSITAGQSAILNIFVRINGTGNITNVANITNVNEENLGNNSTNSTVNISVPSTVNLTISKTSNVTGVVAVGDRVTYTINVTNHGPDNATFVNVTDRLVSALLFLNASATIGSYNNNTGIWTIGTLNVGQTATLYINVSIIGTGNIVNLANVTVREVNLGNNSTNDSVTLTVPSSVNFTISKTSNASANVRYNDIITYTIAVRNYGPDNATGVIVFDELDYRLAYISHTASPGTNYTVSNGVWDIGSLTVGQNVTLTITVRINGTGNIVNVANITTNQDNIGENSTNSTTNGTNFTVPSTVNLTIVKTSNASANASYLDIVSYTVNVTNHGPDNATAVSVLDQIDSRLIVLNTVMNMGNYNIGTGMWDIGTIAAGTSAILTITVQINGTGNISNIANINNFNETINLNDTNNSTVNISVPRTVNLTIVKVSNVTGLDVGVGDLVAYTINVTNHGPDNATGVNVTDVLSNSLLFLNSIATIGNYSNTTHMWTIGNLAVGQTATLTINVQVIGTGNIVNVANVTVNEVNLGNNSTNSSTTFSINSTVNFTISKVSNASANVRYNDIITYTVTVRNFGPDNATGVVVIDRLDPRLAYLSHTATVGTYTVSNGQWDIGDLAAGSIATLTITVRINGTGNIVNVANITSDQNNIGENSTNSSTNGTNFTVPSTVNLTIVKTSNASANVSYLDIVTYTINVTNFGPDNATAVSVFDQIDSRLIVLNTVMNMGNYNIGTGMWDIGTIAAGTSAILTITVQINGTGNITNVANINNFNETINLNDTNNSTVNISVPSTVNLTIVKVSNVTGLDVGVGDLVAYTINVTNHGPDNATGVNVTDILSNRLLFINATANIGIYNNNTGMWAINNLAVGQTATLTINVQVIGTGNIVNVANVTVNEVNLGNNSTNSSTTFSINSTVNFTISKTSNASANVHYNDIITYTVTVRNFGPDNATSVIVIDRLDPRLTYLSHTSSAGTSYTVSNGVWDIGDLAAGSTVTLTITVRINGTGNIVNVANITSDQNNIGENETNSSTNGTNFTVPSTVNLTIVKTSNASANASYLDIVTYTVNVTNHGPDNATAVSVLDQIDSRLIILNIVMNMGTYTVGTGMWDIGTIAAGTSAILTITVQINGTGNISNIANINNFNETINLNDTNNSTVNISVPSTVNLTIVKVSNVTGLDVGVGDLVAYTINVTNHGPDNATGVNVTDILSNRLLFLNATANIGIYNNNTGMWVINNLAVGQTATLTINVQVIGTGNIVNVANVTVNEVNLGNNSTSSNTTFSINSTVNFTISKTSNASASVRYNDIITYTITVRNFGPDNATGVIVIDRIDPRLAYLSHTTTVGTYTVSNGVWDIGNLAAGSTETLTITVRINGTGNIVNVANITSDQNNIGENSTNASSNSTNFTVPTTVNLTVVKTSNASANASYLDIVTYTINVTNHGPDNATAVSVLDVLDYRLALLNANMNLGNYNSLTGEWTIATIAAGQSAILTLTVQIIGTGNIANVANITNFTEEINLNDTNNSTVNITVPRTANVTVTKFSNITGNVTVGTSVLYTIRVTNNGPDNATNVNVTDVLDSRLTFVSASSSSYNPSTGIWSIGALNVGVTLELNITVIVSGTGQIVNVANVSISEVNIGNNSTDGNNSTVNVPASVNITITKNSNVTSNVIVGDLVSYTITVANNGPDNATGLVIIDQLDSRLIFVSASLANYNAANGRWTIGSLAVNQSLTLTINVRVNGTGNIPNIANVTVDQENIGQDNASSIPLGADHIPTSISVENVTQNATMPFTINGNVTSQNGWAVNGFVNITINGTVYSVPVTNGAFSLTNTYNEYGLYNDFTVEYFGDAAFAPSNTTNAWLNILPLSTTTIVNTSTALIFNFTTNITANLTDQFGRPVVGATVTFIVDGITIGTNITNAQGIAIHDFTPGPFPANYTLEATYAGNTTYLSSNDTITRQSRDMGTRITIADVTTKVNRLTEIPIYLHNEFDSPMPNQVIRVEIDGNVYNLTTNGQGIAYLYHTPTEANPLRIDAEFIGNPLLRRSEQMGVLLVEKLATEIVLDNVVVTTVENSTFTAVLKDEDGDLLNNTEVDVYIDGEYVGTFETDTYGRLYYTGPPLPKGDFTISVAFAGSGNVYAGTTSESTLTVRPLRTTTTVSASHVDNETTTFIARLYDEFNKPLADKPMAFFLDGMFIGIAITDFNGVARLNHTYTPGGSIVAEFLGDSIYRESLDNRPFGITPTSNITVDTNSTENDTVPDPIVQGDIDDDDFNYEYDDGDIDGDGTSRSTPLIAMSAAGNPIAMILLSLLAMLFIGLRRRKKN